MKARLTMAGAAAAAAALISSMLVGGVLSPAQAQTGGFQISGTQLLDANGNPFVFRGTSHPHVWFQGETASFAEISDLGANAVRVVLGSGHQWGPNSASDIQNVVNLCKQNQLICMLEVHDATGFGEQAAAVSINQVVDDYWTDPADGILNVLEGEEAFILVNIANEPVGNNNAQQWVDQTITAIQDMRAAGYDHTLVVDAPNWGQDWQFVMRDNAQQIANADPQGNLLFSIHMYEVFGNASAITGYFDAFEQMGLPLVVGEFGNAHNGQNVDEDTIMAEAQQRGIGWIAWSYSGNTDGLLDQVLNFDPNQLTTWGQRVFTGANGIQQTAQRATVFDGDPPPTTPPPTTDPPPTTEPPPTTPPPGGGDCEVSYQANDWGGSPGFTANVTVTNTGGSAIDGWTVQWDYTAGQTVTPPGWNGTVSQSGSTVTAVNAGWNSTIAPGQSTSFGFNGTASSIGNNPAPTGFSCSD